MSKAVRILEGNKGVRKLYDEIARRYDSSKFLRWTRLMERGEEKTVKKWLNKLSGLIVDVGCGTGRYAMKLTLKGVEVVGLDFSQKMLKEAVNKMSMKNRHLFHPVIGNGELLPFKEESFNGVLCTLTFDHFQRCELAASEFSRILKKNGLLILTTFNSYTLRDLKRRLKLPPDKVPFQTEDVPLTLIYEVGHSSKELENLFSKHGFETVNVKGACYWHLIPVVALTKHYPIKLDSIFNLLKPLLKYAEIHITIMKKQTSIPQTRKSNYR